MRCNICGRQSPNKLCPKHEKTLMWDSKLQGFRLKKRNTGSRYTQSSYHKAETKLVRILERVYGLSDVFTSFHPVWAVSNKGVLYEYDVCIPSDKLLIEYNGRQHYEYVPFFHRNYYNFIKQQRRDGLKKRMAKKNNYNLVIFKYDDPITKNFVLSKIGS